MNGPYLLDYIFRPVHIRAMSDTHFFQALSDETRLRIIMLLACDPELPVSALVHAMQLPQPKVSRHLAYLREAGLVAVRREAQWVHYRLDENLPAWRKNVVESTLEGLKNDGIYEADRARLRELTGRPGRCAAA